MIGKAVWRVESTGFLSDAVVFLAIAILAALGARYISPGACMIAGAALFLLIYRLRYKRL